MNERLIERCNNFLREFQMPLTKFCARIELSKTGLRRWQRGELRLSDTTLKRIDGYLARYGF